MSSPCDCQEYQETERTCFRCKLKWIEEMAKHEKVSKCPEHCTSIAICGSSPPLCKDCKDEGYYVVPSFGFCNVPEIKKRETV